jgi:hypothetical protein
MGQIVERGVRPPKRLSGDDGIVPRFARQPQSKRSFFRWNPGVVSDGNPLAPAEIRRTNGASTLRIPSYVGDPASPSIEREQKDDELRGRNRVMTERELE